MELWTQLHDKQEADVRKVLDLIFHTKTTEVSEQADLKQQIASVILSNQGGSAHSEAVTRR